VHQGRSLLIGVGLKRQSINDRSGFPQNVGFYLYETINFMPTITQIL
jgi:hypothetical protein